MKIAMKIAMNTNRLSCALEKNRVFFFIAALAVALLLLPDQAWAGKGGSAFNDVWHTLKDWIQGTLGRIVAASMILVGVIGGIARQSLMAFALGIGGGMGLYNAPLVVETVMSATLEETAGSAARVVTLDNGLGAPPSSLSPPPVATRPLTETAGDGDGR